MAFPTLGEVTTSESSGEADQATITLPGTINSGDLLIAILAVDGTGSNDYTPFSWPAGWTKGTEFFAASFGENQTWAYRIADGNEGASVVVSFGMTGTDPWAAQVYRYTDWHGTTPPEDAGVPPTGQSTTPDPPSLSPSWGAEDTAWIALFTKESGSNDSVSAAPTNYTNLTVIDASGGVGGGRTGCVTARRENNTATEDPGTFTKSEGGGGWIAQTIAIRPAAAPAPSGFVAQVITG